MSIKNHGGVFGRNPTFNDLSAVTITANGVDITSAATDIAGLATTDGNIIVGDGSGWVAESGATARASLGLGSIATQAADNVDIDGGNIDGATIGGSSAVEGTFTNLTATGNTTLGNADTDTVTVTADVASSLIPSADNTYDLGASASEWRDLYIDGTANIDMLDIRGRKIRTSSASGVSTAAGILSNDLIGFAPMIGILHISETGSTRYIMTAFHKAAQANNHQFTTIASDTLTIASSNTVGTVVCGNFTTAANLEWQAIVYDLSP